MIGMELMFLPLVLVLVGYFVLELWENRKVLIWEYDGDYVTVHKVSPKNASGNVIKLKGRTYVKGKIKPILFKGFLGTKRTGYIIYRDKVVPFNLDHVVGKDYPKISAEELNAIVEGSDIKNALISIKRSELKEGFFDLKLILGIVAGLGIGFIIASLLHPQPSTINAVLHLPNQTSVSPLQYVKTVGFVLLGL